MKAESVGLYQIWWKMTTTDPTSCAKGGNDDVHLPTLTLGHLSGAFVVLGVGYGVAFLSFVCELIYRLYQWNNSIVVGL